MLPTIDSPAIQYALRVPAHRYQQGGRVVYLFTLDLATADGVLPQRVDDAVIKDANRKLTPAHAKNIQDYLNDQDEWLLGALMLGIAPDAVEFETVAGYDDFGFLSIRTNRAATMKIFDGQHRRRAIADILSALEKLDSIGGAAKLGELRGASIPVLLYAEDDVKILRQMFVNAAKARPIEANTQARFDRRDAFNLAALRVAEDSALFRGRIEMERPSVPRTSDHVMSINQLARVLKAVAIGQGRRITKERNLRYMDNLDSLYTECLEWTEQFLPAARQEYETLTYGDSDSQSIPLLRSRSRLVDVTFFIVLASCYHIWQASDRDWHQLANFLRQADLGIDADNRLLIDAGLLTPDGRAMFSRRQEVENAMSYILRQAESRAEANST